MPWFKSPLLIFFRWTLGLVWLFWKMWDENMHRILGIQIHTYGFYALLCVTTSIWTFLSSWSITVVVRTWFLFFFVNLPIVEIYTCDLLCSLSFFNIFLFDLNTFRVPIIYWWLNFSVSFYRWPRQGLHNWWRLAIDHLHYCLCYFWMYHGKPAAQCRSNFIYLYISYSVFFDNTQLF